MMFLKHVTIVFFFSLLSHSLKSSSQTLDFTYNGFRRPLNNIYTQGIATVTPSGLLKLTDTTLQQTGLAFYTVPFQFKDSPNHTVSSFSTTFVFAIHSKIPELSGHGIAFVVAPKFELPHANPSQYLGIFNFTNNGKETNHVFAVELDTTQSPQFNDTNDNHVGIDINSLNSVKSSHAGYWDETGQFTNLSLISGKPMQVWVDYNGSTHQIDVTMAPLNHDKPRKPLVSTVRDLSSVFLQDMYVGFASATGSVLSEHYILGWSFRVKGKAPPLALSRLPIFPELGATGSGASPRISGRASPLSTLFIAVSIPLLFIVTLIFLVRFILRRRRKFAEELEDWETEFRKNRLKFKDLYYATKGFKENDLLGTGGFGSVYKGVMPKTKKEIAVKKVSNESRQGLKEFVSEIVTIGRMSHRNLVPLLGYCRRRKELLLVYEYMPNGSLDKYLYNSPEVTLDWKQRSKVIKGVASALFYLHEDWEQVVIHRDIKASNVLLDAEHNARLGDFGLARLCGHGTDPQTTHVAGTWGYLAPDHMRTGKATTATDVFAFGVLLLEVACGRRPIEMHTESGERILLVDWVFGFWNEGNILDAKDPNLGTEYDQREVEVVLKLGLLCSHSNPQARPTMRQVLHYLSGDALLPDLSPLDLCGSEMMSGIYHGFSDVGMFMGGSTMVDSVLSGGRYTERWKSGDSKPGDYQLNRIHDNWSGLGRLQEILGERGHIDMGITANASVAEVLISHRRRRKHRNNILNQIEDVIDIHRQGRESDKKDIALWKQRGSEFKAKFSSKNTWMLIHQSQGLQPWTKCIWFPFATPKYNFLTWLALQNKLSTGERTQNWNQTTNTQCVLCNQSLESRNHLFFDCSYGAEVWERLTRGIMKTSFTTSWPDIITFLLDTQMNYTEEFLMKYIFQAVLYGIWRERNLRKHVEKPSTPSRLIKLLDKTIRNRLTTARDEGDKKLEDSLIFWFSVHPTPP